MNAGEPRPPHKRLALRIAHLPSYLRLVAAALVALAAGFALPRDWAPAVRLVASWDGFALIELGLTWFTILSLGPQHIRSVAQNEDPSRVLSLVLVVLGAASSLLAVIVLLQSSAALRGNTKGWVIGLALSGVVLAWVIIHTVFTLRYAHIYYAADEPAGGLDFPGDDMDPEYLDFAYFAFVVGMTAQTSDVEVVSRRLRMIVLLHSVIAFAFNTAVVALSIGVLTTLL